MQSEGALDAIDTTSEIAKQLPDRFQITLEFVHGLQQALSAKRVGVARHFLDE